MRGGSGRPPNERGNEQDHADDQQQVDEEAAGAEDEPGESPQNDQDDADPQERAHGYTPGSRDASGPGGAAGFKKCSAPAAGGARRAANTWPQPYGDGVRG